MNRSQGSNPCFSANTLKPYCSVGFFYYIFLIFIFFEHTQIEKPRAKASHQADNLTKLWQEFLSVLELIVQILCAVEVQKPSVALGNAHL